MEMLAKYLVILTTLAILTGCATVDFDYPKQESVALKNTDTADTYLDNPLEDFSVVGTGDKWFGAKPRPESPETIRLIMKDGVIYKNTL